MNPAYTLVGYDAHSDLYVYRQLGDEDSEITLRWSNASYTEADLAWFRRPLTSGVQS